MQPEPSTSSTPDRFQPLLESFAGKSVLVLGDMVVDEYIVGRPAQISREAPILVLHYSDSYVLPGGATNAANNVASLGARAVVLGVVGDDEMGRTLRALLDEKGMDTSGLLVDPSRPTTTKTRVLGKGTQEVQQQIVRIDRVDVAPVDGELRRAMIDAFHRLLPQVDAVLVSDYANGVISQEILDTCLPAARDRGIITIVDSHGDLFRFHSVTATTPNQPEVEGTLGVAIETDDDLCEAGEKLLEGMQAKAALITRGSEGIALFEAGQCPYLLPVAIDGDTKVVDPNGAGDTVSAVFTLALTAGASMRTAAYLANVAGGEAVRHSGPVALTPQQLASALSETRLTPPDATV
jgi:rfaE bifunctional protein kinase chain/domain